MSSFWSPQSMNTLFPMDIAPSIRARLLFYLVGNPG